MSAFVPSTGLNPAPKSKTNSLGTGRKVVGDESLDLSLKTVIGTTTDSGNAFDCLPNLNIYATCAGSAVVLAQVDEQLNVTQRFYKAGSSVAAANTNAPSNSRTLNGLGEGLRGAVSPFRDGKLGNANLATYGDSFVHSPGKSRASTRTRSANCVSLSADCQFLAVGEIGYNPRINIFGISDGDPDIPLTVLNEHSNFGVRSVAFSHDSRWLCSLGNVNDGFVFLWSISKNGGASLHSSNKCISSVQALAWMRNSVITVGTRHVKVWRLEPVTPASPIKNRNHLTKVLDGPSSNSSPKTFSGRNCLLGPFVDSKFTCVAALSDCTALLCTEHGDICRLDDTDQRQRLERVAKATFRVLCISVDQEKGLVLLGGRDGQTQAIPLHRLIKYESGLVSSEGSPSPSPRLTINPMSRLDHCADILAVGSLRDHLIFVDANHQILIVKPDTASSSASNCSYEKRISAHESAVLGIGIMPQPNKQEADFMTWSSQGTALFWTMIGICRDRLVISLEPSPLSTDGDANELKLLRATNAGEVFLFGDKNGNIGYYGACSKVHRAHNGEVTDMSLAQRDDGISLIASCGRDRTLQLFQLIDDGLEILQTMENEHGASINSLMFSNRGEVLISASADRTIVVRAIAFGKSKKATFFPTKVLTLKSSPVAFAMLSDGFDTIMVSTIDRQLHKYDLKTGGLVHSFKATDSARSESVPLHRIKIGRLHRNIYHAPIVLGVSSTDKSIRAYDSDTGVLLAREYGQLVASDCALLQRPDEDDNVSQVVVSTGLDGTIMIWELVMPSHRQTGSEGSMSGKNTPYESSSSSYARPLRRILSKSELVEYQQSLENAQDPSTPTRSQHPSRVRNKTSRLTLGGALKHSAANVPKSAHHSPSSSVSETREQKHIAPLSKGALASRTRRASSDAHSPHAPAAEDNHNLMSSTHHVCQNLRGYRDSISASSDILTSEMAEELEQQLALTLTAIRTKTKSSNERTSDEANQDGSMDGWLARMIDERLALRLGAGGSENGKLGEKEHQASSSGGATEEHAEQ